MGTHLVSLAADSLLNEIKFRIEYNPPLGSQLGHTHSNTHTHTASYYTHGRYITPHPHPLTHHFLFSMPFQRGRWVG